MRPIFTISILLLSLLALPLFAASLPLPLQLLQPNATLSVNSQVDIGSIGPGQTFTIEINPTVTKNNEFLGLWDQSYAVSLPAGWTSRPSKLYQNPMQVQITPAPDTPDGDYVANLTVIDEAGQEHIGNQFPFQALIHVRHDVLAMSVDPASAEVGAGQPATFTLALTNTGSAPDVFEISSSGVSGWAFQKRAYLAPGASKTFNYEVVGNDESDYHVTLSARSTSSPLIGKDQSVGLTVRTNLLSDYRATSHGVLLFPVQMVPFYSLSGFLSLFFP